ncbi:MAG: RNA methyltransferase [Opitutus sp.]|nr:RNA methyltransferase [Opitutus sp.]
MPLTKAEISRLRSLQEKKQREALGLFVVEGEKVIAELLAAHFPFVELYATEEWPGPGKHNAQPEGDASPSPASATHAARVAHAQTPPRATLVTSAEMARLSHYPTPSTVFAVGKVERRALAPHALDRGLTLALDGIQDPGNVGTLLRIADWFAFDRVVLSPDSADLFSQKVINASMGSFARVATHTVVLADALAGCTAPVLGCDLEGDDVHALGPLHDVVVVIGSEGRGLSPAVAARVTRRVTIPKFGGAESLNAGVAAAIVCDNLRRVAGRSAG